MLLCFDSWISSGIRSVSRNMSNSIGHNLFHQSLIRPTVLEHQSKLNTSSIPTNSLFQSAPNQGAAHVLRSPMSPNFFGNSLKVQKSELVTGTGRHVTFTPSALLATDSASEVISPATIADYVISFWTFIIVSDNHIELSDISKPSLVENG